MDMLKYLLIINTGNTSTKVGLYKHREPVVVETIKHTDEMLAPFHDINSQKDFREKLVFEFLSRHGIAPEQLGAVAARGGLLRPLESGTYRVNNRMIADLIEGKRGLHASHLSAQIGRTVAKRAGVDCYVVDPISVDEFQDIARYSGHRLFERIMLTHALNMKAVAKRHAEEQGKPYSEMALVVAHLGTGISLSVHRNGRMIDAINPREEGPFSPDRSGGLPVLQAVQYVLDHHLDCKTFSKMVFGNGGVFSYLGTRDFVQVENRVENGDTQAVEVVDAMAYQVAKEIGALATVLSGAVDAILLTGGMAKADFFVNRIKRRVAFLAPVVVYPGEDEIQALAEGVFRVLSGEETVKEY